MQRNDRPFFIDKMPNNFRHVGLIHLMLPNAKIIDARRDPMACCFSFKQLFASGQQFTYGLEDLGVLPHYVFLMDHWDRVLPGRVLHVRYEDVMDDLRAASGACWIIAASRSSSACRFPEPSAACARRARSRCAGRSTARGSTSGAISRCTWVPLQDALGPVLERYPVE